MKASMVVLMSSLLISTPALAGGKTWGGTDSGPSPLFPCTQPCVIIVGKGLMLQSVSLNDPKPVVTEMSTEGDAESESQASESFSRE